MQKTTINLKSTFSILTLVVSFSSLLAQPLNNDKLVDKIVAKVNDGIILKSELEISKYQAQMSGGYFEDDVECKVLESMIINKMLVAQADIDSVTVTESMVNSQIERRMQYFIMQFGPEERLVETYGKSIKELKDELRVQMKEQMLMQKMQEQIMGKVTITPSDVKKFYKKIPKDSLPYFPTEVQIGQIVKYPEINNEQKQKVIEQLNELKQRILEGEDFCTLAKGYSTDPGTKDNCGELGFFGKGELVPEYESAARNLQPGGLSEPVESQFGFHLIQLIERRGGQYNTRHILIKPDASSLDGDEAYNYLNKLKTKIEADSISFERAARKYSEDKLTSASGGLFSSPSTASTKLPMDQIEPDIFFVIDTMKVNSVSPPLPYKSADGKTGYRIIYYKSKTPPHIANLNDDYTKLSEATLNEKKSIALEDWFLDAKDNMYIEIDEDYKNCKILEQQ